jgi:hypothetical protein
LAEGQITAEDGDACGAECFSQRDEQRRLAVGAGAVGEDEGVCVGIGGAVKKAADGSIGSGGVEER